MSGIERPGPIGPSAFASVKPLREGCRVSVGAGSLMPENIHHRTKSFPYRIRWKSIMLRRVVFRGKSATVRRCIPFRSEFYWQVLVQIPRFSLSRCWIIYLCRLWVPVQMACSLLHENVERSFENRRQRQRPLDYLKNFSLSELSNSF